MQANNNEISTLTGGPPKVEETTTESAVAPTSKATAAKGKATQTKRKNKKAVRRKPDDMPRRPLSSYNYFFSEMRTKLLADRAAGKEGPFQQFLAEREKIDGPKKNGFFSNMGKFVAKQWKELNPDELQPYSDMAEKDLQRYRREMDEYREGVARKTRLASEQKLREQEEAAKAPQSNPMANGMVGQPQGQMQAQQALGGMMGHPMMMQNPADPFQQFLLRQQLLNPNPQLNAFFLQQQFGQQPGGLQQFGMFQQPQAGQPGQMQQQQPQQGIQLQGGDPSQHQQGQQAGMPQQQQQFSQDMSQQQGQQQQDFMNSLQQQQQQLQQQQRMGGMFPTMGQFAGGMAMPTGMPGMGGVAAGQGGVDDQGGMNPQMQQLQGMSMQGAGGGQQWS